MHEAEGKESGPRVGVAIPAAGTGRRMGGTGKAFLTLAGEPILLHSLRPFLSHPGVVSVVVALSPDAAHNPPDWLPALDPRIRLVAGGRTRLESVGAALEAFSEEVDVVLVHDAARPLVTRDVIERCIQVAAGGEGAVAGWPAVDTLKEVDGSGYIVSTPDRAVLRHAQTPQAFPRRPLLEAYRSALAEGAEATDDATLFARAGGRVRMVAGGAWNLKVTHPEDVPIAELLLRMRDTAEAPFPGRGDAS
jgi:2-C-methyl-D-erythritol 4-phosphate cytidylyltransferase